MKKHFLLLFLMALLPLVGWADDPKPKVIINAAYTYKTYGDVDPTTPNFEYDQSSENKPDKTVINPFLKLKRVNGQVGEIVGSYLYYIDLDEETYPDQCDYEIVILQNNSNLVVQKADLHVVVTNNFKEFNHADPDPFEYTLVDPTELKYDDTEESVEITITRPGAEVTDPVNAARNPQTGVPEYVDGPHYTFAGEAENYKIIVDNEFLVVPSMEIDNVLVTVKKFTAIPATFSYIVEYIIKYIENRVDSDEDFNLNEHSHTHTNHSTSPDIFPHICCFPHVAFSL